MLKLNPSRPIYLNNHLYNFNYLEDLNISLPSLYLTQFSHSATSRKQYYNFSSFQIKLSSSGIVFKSHEGPGLLSPKWGLGFQGTNWGLVLSSPKKARIFKWVLDVQLEHRLWSKTEYFCKEPVGTLLQDTQIIINFKLVLLSERLIIME